MAFDFSPLFRADLPPPAAPWAGFPRYNFVGGHNDADSVPRELLASLASDALRTEGASLATYGLSSGPQGYRPLRDGIAKVLEARAGMACAAEQILVTSGSLQALDLVNAVFLAPGDTVIAEDVSYGGAYTRLRRCGVNIIGAALDEEGIRMDALAGTLDDLASRGVRPKYIYTIPTVQNPSGSVMSTSRRRALLDLATRHQVPIFEDDCYADLTWEGDRPPTIRSLDDSGRVIYCGSFSKTVAPALRVGYLVADWPVMGQLLAMKTDAGSGALEQMVLARFLAGHFDAHVEALTGTLKNKCALMMEAVAREFGTSADFQPPKGGIFLWVSLPESVDTSALAAAALSRGVAINPGAEWSADAGHGRHRMRLCFGNASASDIREGVALLAQVCREQTGIPARSGNVEPAPG